MNMINILLLPVYNSSFTLFRKAYNPKLFNYIIVTHITQMLNKELGLKSNRMYKEIVSRDFGTVFGFHWIDLRVIKGPDQVYFSF
jgi:hypothetical protein